MLTLVRTIERAAAAAALALLAWAATGVDPARRQWVDAVRGELDAIEGGWSQFAWALGGVRLALHLGGMQRRQTQVPRLGMSLPGIVPLVVIGLVLIGGASAALSAANQPDTQCTTAHTPSADPPTQLASATDYLALGDYDYDRGACNQAIVDYTRAVELDPQFAAAYNNRAYTFMRQQDYAAALPDLDRAIELRPDYAHALMNRADIYNYYYRIDRQRAMADYDHVIALGQTPHTSVCGHRLLAYYDGWNAGVVVNILTRGIDGGCDVGKSALTGP